MNINKNKAIIKKNAEVNLLERKIIIIPVIILILYIFPLCGFAAEPDDIISETAVLMDAETGQIIFDKSGDKMMFPASTTKIMTGLLAAEKCDMDEIAEVTQSAVDIDEWNSANIALIPGEKLPVDSLMYGMMLPSANDAANVLAEHVAGNQRDFAQLMTERARAAGAANTRFDNAHGLHSPNHYTTARDMALITRQAIKNPVFMQYFGAGTHTIPPTNLQPLPRPFTNYQYMLVNTSRYYDPTVAGGKVGYTTEARHTMSTVAVKNGRTLICVVMYSLNRGDKFADTKKLLDFGFDEFTEISVPKEDFPGFSAEIMNGEAQTGTVSFKSERDFTALLHNSLDLSTLKISYSRDGAFEEGEDIEVYAEFTVQSNHPAIPASLGRIRLEADISNFATANSATLTLTGDLASALYARPWMMPAIIAGFALTFFAVLFAIRQISIHRRRKRRRQRLARLQTERETFYQGPKPTVSRRR